MLNSPFPSMPPLFHFPASKAFLESPDQYVSPERAFRLLAHTNTQMWRLELCSSIRPRPGVHCFSFLQAILESRNQ